MDKTTPAVGVDTTIDYNDPLFLHPTNTPGITLIALQLTCTENYALWSRYMKIALLGKNKLECNAIVLSWILNVVSKELVTEIAYASNSRRVWENLKEKFDKENSLSDLWGEFDFLSPPPTCNCDTSRTFTKHIQKNKVFQFLTGLNDSYS
ncbi:hypothetical protein R3W88_008531 [Solanum pinnatisectum]|uniref:Retrotransposon Copia-like N-terminal domain-containing protein n=1 Tax=Solanum pinnatisectum TaxID=50273 RepID=A0AAV9MBM1_9SOLN|nr:hypothetical protein R3W88_008531 [Solanum pinnatisectum]